MPHGAIVVHFTTRKKMNALRVVVILFASKKKEKMTMTLSLSCSQPEKKRQ
jgi:hypothetical protein